MHAVNAPSLPAQKCPLMLEMSGLENIPHCPHVAVHLIESSHDPLSSGYVYDLVPPGRAVMEHDSEGKDWLTFVNLQNEHKWHHITLTGAALQAATVTLNKVITTLRTSHAIQKCLKELETDVMQRISVRDYSSLYSSSVLFQALTIWDYTAIDCNTKEK